MPHAAPDTHAERLDAVRYGSPAEVFELLEACARELLAAVERNDPAADPFDLAGTRRRAEERAALLTLAAATLSDYARENLA